MDRKKAVVIALVVALTAFVTVPAVAVSVTGSAPAVAVGHVGTVTTLTSVNPQAGWPCAAIGRCAI